MFFVSIGNEKDIAGTRASWLKKEKSPNATCVRTQSGAGDSLLLAFTQIDILYSSDSVRLCSTRKLQQKYSHAELDVNEKFCPECGTKAE